jgi:hypothetical protein
MNGPTVSFKKVLCKRQTPKAILCEVKGRELWIPQSQIHEDSEVYQDGDEGTLVVSEWFAEKENLV